MIKLLFLLAAAAADVVTDTQPTPELLSTMTPVTTTAEPVAEPAFVVDAIDVDSFVVDEIKTKTFVVDAIDVDSFVVDSIETAEPP